MDVIDVQYFECVYAAIRCIPRVYVLACIKSTDLAAGADTRHRYVYLDISEFELHSTRVTNTREQEDIYIFTRSN